MKWIEILQNSITIPKENVFFSNSCSEEEEIIKEISMKHNSKATDD